MSKAKWTRGGAAGNYTYSWKGWQIIREKSYWRILSEGKFLRRVYTLPEAKERCEWLQSQMESE